MVKKKYDTLEKLISKFIEVHDNRYGYSKVIFGPSKNKIIITCLIHGDFPQLYKEHIKGAGCPYCAGNARKTTEQFIIEAKKKHGNKYDYIFVNYINSKTLIKIICPIHGVFEQFPNNHLRHGCDDCGGKVKLTTEEFIRKARIIHGDKYDYSKSNYKLRDVNIIIICEKHGEFKQTPDVHLYGGGCKFCSNNSSKLEIEWLNYLNIEEKYRQIVLKINDKRYNLDAYNIETNTIYEFYGDFWHGNPNIKKYSHDKINKKNKTTFGDLYKKTMERENILKFNGYNLVTIWESDWENIKKRYIEQEKYLNILWPTNFI